MHDLWTEVLDSRWQLSREALGGHLAHCVCLVAEWEEVFVGFCSGSSQHRGPAAVTALLVDARYRGRKIGSALLHCMEARLLEAGATTLRLGSGVHPSYFWPGVPVLDVRVWTFFAHHGWLPEEPVYDLLQPLNDQAVDRAESSVLVVEGCRLVVASAERRHQILAFEALHFPIWARSFEEKLQEDRSQEILLLLTSHDEVVGSVLLESSSDLRWRGSLGPACASLSALGIAPRYRQRGLGLAFVAAVFRHARQSGYTSCYINWTGLVEWYGRLGALSWAEYTPAKKRNCLRPW